jgi:energy-coupling factor transporter ATP-binding protein EcfA2
MAKRKSQPLQNVNAPDVRDIEIENVGPIEHLALRAEPGHVTVLRGPNGSGKSTALRAVDSAQTGKKGLENRDGTVNGSVSALGVRIKIARNGANRSSGDLVIESVEGDLNIADFVDPGLKDQAAADSRRIRAVAILTGVEPKEELFHDLLDGGVDEFRKLVDPDDRNRPDIVELAGAIKRALESHARKIEGEAENVDLDIRSKQDANSGINLSEPHDAAELESAVESARDAMNELINQKKYRTENSEAYERAKSRLETDAPAVESLESQRDEALAEEKDLAQRIQDLKVELRDLEMKHESVAGRVDTLNESIRVAKSQADDRAELESLVAAYESSPFPSDEEIERATVAWSEAKAKRDRGVTVRDAIKRENEIAELDDKLSALQRRAESLRSAARGTENVLASVIQKANPRLKVDREFRLVVVHPKRGECYFSDLSMGERWRVGIEIALDAFKQKNIPGLLQIPQEAWESLDGDNRLVIRQAIAGTDLSIVTAEATHEPGAAPSLVAEVLD